MFGVRRAGASEGMSSFCSRLTPISGGNVDIGQSAGGAGSAISAGGGAEENAAVRRRRDAASQVNEATDELTVSLSANLSAFFSADYQRHEQRSTEFAGGRDGRTAAANVGLDYRFANTGVAGFALRGEQLDGDYDAGGDFESRSYSATLFGSWFPADNAFVDVSFNGGVKNNESRRFVTLTRLRRNQFSGVEFIVIDIPEARADSEYDATELGGDVRLGYDFQFGRFTLGPRVAARYRRIDIDAYAEQGDTIMKLAFDKQTEDSLRSVAGMQASAAFTVGGTVLVPQLNGEWIHEFRNDQRYITARFVDDYRANATRLRFQNEAPDRDVYVGRFSLVAVFQAGVSAFITAEKLFGHDYQDQYGGSVGVRVEF
jgi:outer membrane lipase/esterase